MSRDKIIAMAKEAGFPPHIVDAGANRELACFAALVAAKEREACAQVCDAKAKDGTLSNRRRCDADSMAMAIRARGKPRAAPTGTPQPVVREQKECTCSNRS